MPCYVINITRFQLAVRNAAIRWAPAWEKTGTWTWREKPRTHPGLEHETTLSRPISSISPREHKTTWNTMAVRGGQFGRRFTGTIALAVQHVVMYRSSCSDTDPLTQTKDRILIQRSILPESQLMWQLKDTMPYKLCMYVCAFLLPISCISILVTGEIEWTRHYWHSHILHYLRTAPALPPGNILEASQTFVLQRPN